MKESEFIQIYDDQQWCTQQNGWETHDEDLCKYRIVSAEARREGEEKIGKKEEGKEACVLFYFFFVENKTFLVREERANRCKIRKVKKATDEHFTLELSLKKTIILSTHNHSLLSLFLLTMKWWPYYFTSPFLSLKMKSTPPF